MDSGYFPFYIPKLSEVLVLYTTDITHRNEGNQREQETGQP
jgi:hypothetical protein